MSFTYFKVEEFACQCGCGVNLISHDFVQKLDNLRYLYGKPMVVTSGYRCPKHNAKVSNTGATGPHTTGRAADIRVDRANAVFLLRLAMESKDFTGFGAHQKGPSRFLHLDDLTEGRPTIWTY